MLGAIIGDIIGSIYERNNIKTKDFPLFGRNCSFTDDTVMTVATAEALMNGGEEDDFIDAYKKWGRMYPHAGYGAQFAHWIQSADRQPYRSWGNGSAMRVSPCAWNMSFGYYDRVGFWPANARNKAIISARVTHSHPEGIRGALAVTDAIFMCRIFNWGGWHTLKNPFEARTISPEQRTKLKRFIETEHGYDLSKTLDEIRPAYSFDVSCQGTVPQAIIAFLESTDFEDAIRNAISLGGDSDTLAAITGSIAEAAYGIPDDIKEKAFSYLDRPLIDMYHRWIAYLKQTHFGIGR